MCQRNVHISDCVSRMLLLSSFAHTFSLSGFLAPSCSFSITSSSAPFSYRLTSHCVTKTKLVHNCFIGDAMKLLFTQFPSRILFQSLSLTLTLSSIIHNPLTLEFPRSLVCKYILLQNCLQSFVSIHRKHLCKYANLIIVMFKLATIFVNSTVYKVVYHQLC